MHLGAQHRHSTPTPEQVGRFARIFRAAVEAKARDRKFVRDRIAHHRAKVQCELPEKIAERRLEFLRRESQIVFAVVISFGLVIPCRVRGQRLQSIFDVVIHFVSSL